MNGEKHKTKLTEEQITSSLKNLRDQNLISKSIYEKLRPTGTSIPRVYGLPKVHKRDTPLGSILDMSASPYHHAARWLAESLEPVRRNTAHHSLKDIFEFVDFVKEQNTNDLTMGSLDVTSLLTNIPILECIEYLCDNITTNDLNIGIPVINLTELLLRCTFNVQFLFDGLFYRQTDGIAMGSPFGPLLADVFIAKLENQELRDTIM
ncbi:unnamed protein product [Echinostoma caproni]|uniref:Reverse transcriptase domain-containing protein n=1 Tax=Echinostoma caproni TaxID=27848 RepID=A0A183AID7_9TREM|nr:unnamed protein product [Echinostoma caproni]